MNKTALWNAIKEPLRLMVLAIIPVILVWLGTINTQWAIIIVAVLRFIDKFLHEIGKETGNESLTKGLVGF